MSKDRLYEGAPLNERYIYGKNKPMTHYSTINSMDNRKPSQQVQHEYNQQVMQRQQPSQQQYYQQQHNQKQQLAGTSQRKMYNVQGSESDLYQQQLDKEINDLNMSLAKLSQLSPYSKSSTVTDSTWSAPTTPHTPHRELNTVPGQSSDVDCYNVFQSCDTSTNGKFKMDFDMKDFVAHDVSLSLNNRELKICAKKKIRCGQKMSTLERKSRVRIPDTIDPTHLKAKLSSDDGILTIEAPTLDGSLENPAPKHRGAMSEDDEYLGSFREPTDVSSYTTNNRRHHNNLRHRSEYPSRTPHSLKTNSTICNRQNMIPGNSLSRTHTLPMNNYTSSTDRDIPIKTYNSMSRGRTRSHVEDMQSNVYGTFQRGRSKQRSRSVGPSHKSMNMMNRSMDTMDYYNNTDHRAHTSSMAAPVRTTTVRASIPETSAPADHHERRMTVSVFIGEGYRTDQLLVKNILPFDRFVVTAQPDTWQNQHREYRKIFNWPAPVEASSIAAFMRPDGTLTVTALMTE